MKSENLQVYHVTCDWSSCVGAWRPVWVIVSIEFCNTIPLLSIIPSLGDLLTCLTTLSAASQWETLGCCINCLRTFTLKQISGLVIVKYNSLPINLHMLTSSNSESSEPPMCWSNTTLVNLWLNSNGVLTIFAPLSLVSEISCKSYFLWFNNDPSFDFKTSIPNKILKTSQVLRFEILVQCVFCFLDYLGTITSY